MGHRPQSLRPEHHVGGRPRFHAPIRAAVRRHGGGVAGRHPDPRGSDVPYWPVQSTWTYKEVWVHPVTRWIWLMRDLAGPALVEGQAGAPVEFEEATMGRRIWSPPTPSRDVSGSWYRTGPM